jgi:hypothetical protein
VYTWQVTAYLEQLKQVLKEKYSIELTFHGQQYPGDAQVRV